MVSSIVNYLSSLPDPSVQRRTATNLSILSGAGIVVNIARRSIFSWTTLFMIAGIVGGLKMRQSISFTSRVEYFQKKLLQAGVEQISNHLPDFQKECRALGKEYQGLPNEKNNLYLQKAFRTMIQLLHPKTANRKLPFDALKSIRQHTFLNPIAIADKEIDQDESLPISPKIDDPFLAWLKNNRHLNDLKRSIIKNAYESAINSSNPNQIFSDRMRELENNTTLSQKTCGYCLAEFKKVRAKPRPLIRSRSSPFIEFNAGTWSKSFQGTTNPIEKRRLLGIIRSGTLDALDNGKYRVHGNTVPLSHVLTNKMKKGTTLFVKAPPLILGDSFEDTKIEVIKSDVIDAAVHAKENGFRSPVFINMARADKPCGSFFEDSPAGEENNARRSNLWQSLSFQHNPEFYKRSRMIDGMKRPSYNIPRGGAILTPDLQVFRGNEFLGYPFLEVPVELACISIAAPDLNPAHHRSLPCKPNSADHAKWLDASIDTFLSAAYNNGHDALVLSAVGCGSYKNDPSFVASRFAHVLGQAKWRGKFGSVCFAILGKDNLNAFDVLKGQVLGKSNNKLKPAR